MINPVHFNDTDQVIAHLGTIVHTLAPALQGQYVGFAAVSAVTVYERAVKELFCEFSKKKHLRFGYFVEKYFERINGRVSLGDLKKEYLKRFGDAYLVKFERLLDAEEKSQLLTNNISIKSSYGNIIAWRNEFAHEGRVPTNATFAEVQKAYGCGKILLNCLDKALVR